MIFAALLVTHLVAQVAFPAQNDSATYASDRVRRIVDSAAVLNSRVPPALGRYSAELETEIAAGIRRGDGAEATVGLEQVASTLTWDRHGNTEQRVIGYRSQSVGPSFSSLGFFEYAWAVPSLYGNRMALMFGQDTNGKRIRRAARNGRTAMYAVHPLARDREKFYRFSGGDTVLTMRVSGREIPIVRVMVTPRNGLADRTIVFDGEVDLDAKRWHVVRMRGHFGVSGGRPTLLESLRSRAVQGVAYVELVNRELNGEYWVPQYQRFEVHGTAAIAGDTKVIYRILTYFRRFDVESLPPGLAPGALDGLEIRPHGITIASRETLASYRGWRNEIGATSADARATDFDDVAPENLRPSGNALIRLQVERFSDLVRFDRVEGLFTGVGVTARLRDRAPGVLLRATGGWAWSERAARGRLAAEYVRGGAKWGLVVGRTLDVTNDFRSPFDSGSTVGALFGQDNNDYVDRRIALSSLTRTVGGSGVASVRLESGMVGDHGVEAHVFRGPLARTDSFLPNRGVRPGTYLRSAFELRVSPDLDANLLRPGGSAVLRYERGDGTLNYQRLELRVMQRMNHGAWTFATRFDAGVLFGSDPPPQQQFEIGSSENLAAYAYKEFAGDQAAVLRGIAMYKLPLFRAPIHLANRFWLPEPSPAFAVVLQGGWTGLSGDAARRAAYELGVLGGLPVSRATGSARASLGVGLRFFGSAMGVMALRPLDHPEAWRLRVDFNPQP